MNDKNMIPMDTYERCPRCKQQTKHEWRVNRDVIYKRCTMCGNETVFETHKLTTLYDRILSLTQGLDRVRSVSEQLNAVGNSILAHKWSANLGKKDRAFIENLLAQILHAKGDIDKL